MSRTRRQEMGQHILTSACIASRIADAAGIRPDQTVLELGTGTGVLLPYLCGRAKRVVSVEMDPAMYKYAQERHHFPNLDLVCGDGFETAAGFNVFVSNLPYSQSRRAVEWLCCKRFSHALVTVQKEFADKLLRRDKAVSTLARYCFDINTEFDVPRDSFVPKPLVDSTAVSLIQKNTVSRDVVGAVNAMFSQRRKKLSNILARLGVAPGRDATDGDLRLEEMRPDSIIAIARHVAASRG